MSPEPIHNEQRPPGVDTSVDLFSRGGEMGRRMRDIDWAATPLGAPAHWPQSLRSALSICLGSGFPIAIYWGPSLALLYNDAWSPILGTKHPWAIGRPAAAVWPEIWDTIGPDFAQVMEGGRAIYREDQLLPMRRHGYTEECYFNYTFSPIRGEGGRVDGVFNAVIETTYRAIAERRTQALRALGERISAARSGQDACVIAAETLGAAPADVPFCALYLVDEPTQSAHLASSSPSALAEQWPKEAALTVDDDGPWALARSWRSGQLQHLRDLDAPGLPALPGGPWPEPAREALVVPVRTGGTTQPAGFLIVGASPRRAVDEEYRLFAERAGSHVALAMVNAAAYELERRRAEALAEIDRAKTVFFSNISHELRTPLTLMLGPTEEAIRSAQGALTGDDLAVVHRNARRLLTLVNALLDFSRIEAGRLEAHFQPTDVAALTAELASVFRSAVERAGLRLEVDAAQPVMASVDRDMWEKVILNLLSNALKHTFEGAIRVGVQRAGDAVEVAVADSGVGIPAAHVPRIFERFHRVPSVRSRTHEGTGIGLALVAELVKLHHGTIEVDSQVDRGTQFLIRLPALAHAVPGDARPVLSPSARAQAEGFAEWLPDDPAAEAVEPLSTGVATSMRSRVLVADDNADMRSYITRLLGGSFDVDVARDGAEALARFRAHPPDVVLSDVMMPGLDGFGLLRAIRAEPSGAATPIILLSARAGEEARIEGREAGADDYLIKPFGARELVATVRAHAVLAAQRRELERHVRDEATLRDAAARASSELDRILSSVGEGFAALDAGARYVYVNDAALAMVGMQRDDVLGRTPQDVFPPEVFAHLQPHLEEALTHGRLVHYEIHLPGLDRWFENRLYPSSEGVSVFFSDVTARKRAEETLRRSEASQRMLVSLSDATRSLRDPDQILWEVVSRAAHHFQASGCTYGEVDASEEFVDVNRAYNVDPAASVVGRHRLDAFGVSLVAELRAGRTVAVREVLTDPRTKAPEVAAAFEAVQTRSVIAVPLVKEGRFVALFVLHHRAPREWTEHEIALVEQIVERTWSSVEHARAEADLRESRDVLSLAMRGGRMGTWARNIVTGDVWWSRELEELFGLEPGAFEGTTAGFRAFVHEDDREMVDRAVAGAITSHTDYVVEFRFRHASGEWRWMEGRGRAVYDADGTPRTLYGLGIDITERRRAADALAAARDAAESANRLKDQFLATLSHELRTPLNAILGYARMLRTNSLRDDRRQPALDAIERNALAQNHLVEDLLDISRITLGKVRLETEPIEAAAPLREAIDVIRPAAAAKALELEVTLDPAAGTISGDAGRLQQVYWNILANAVKFTPAGGRIDVTLTEREGSIDVVVADTGIGIAPEFLPFVFEPFRQADPRSTRAHGGLGLGLAISRELVELHGGTVDVESPGVGRGSRFVVSLPTGRRGGSPASGL